jgi:hypothetical protein
MGCRAGLIAAASSAIAGGRAARAAFAASGRAHTLRDAPITTGTSVACRRVTAFGDRDHGTLDDSPTRGVPTGDIVRRDVGRRIATGCIASKRVPCEAGFASARSAASAITGHSIATIRGATRCVSDGAAAGAAGARAASSVTTSSISTSSRGIARGGIATEAARATGRTIGAGRGTRLRISAVPTGSHGIRNRIASTGNRRRGGVSALSAVCISREGVTA